jgi:hypothetical protein
MNFRPIVAIVDDIKGTANPYFVQQMRNLLVGISLMRPTGQSFMRRTLCVSTIEDGQTCPVGLP